VPAGGNSAASSNPLCQNAMGQYSTVQTRAKAYPGIRQLQVLQGLGDQAVVASICPSNVTNTTAADFGYRPAAAALVKRVGSLLRGRCFPSSLEVLSNGGVACRVVEAYDPPAGSTCNCNDRPGRLAADPAVLTPEIRAKGSCFCEIVQLDEPDRTICQTQIAPPGSVRAGWCYVDPAQAGANREAECAVLRGCPADGRRLVRFVNPDSEPRSYGTGFLVCDTVSTPPVTPDPCP
jgi:hypothetical protein